MGVAEGRHEGLLADLLAGAPGVREALRAGLQDARACGDAAQCARCATLLLLHTLADFADFRGIAEARAAFDPEPAAAADRPRADAVRLGLPSLDHALDHADPALAPVRARLFEALRQARGLGHDERLLLAKLLVDHDCMRNDYAAAERVLASLQDAAAMASALWQLSWWRLAAEVYTTTGHTVLAQAAMGHLQALLPQVRTGEALMSQASEDMRHALHLGDLARAERAYRAIDQQRPHVRPALQPRGLLAQATLLLRRGAYGAALELATLMLALAQDHEVPERDCGLYVEQQAYALLGLGRHAEAAALLETLRASQPGGQGEVLEAIVAMVRAVQALDTGEPDAPDVRAQVLQAVRRAEACGFNRFLMSFPAWAARIAAIGLDAGVATEFLERAMRERRLPPPDPARERWPWALHVQVLGGLVVRRDGVPLGGAGGGKAQKKPLELLALLAAHPAGLDSETLIDALWPSLDADAPRASLEMTVSRLRKWLDLPEAVKVADGRVSLNGRIVWTDVAAFEAALQAGDAAAALAIYRGAFLQGEWLDALALRTREQLSHRLAALLLQQAAALRAAGRATEALALLGRGLALEPASLPLQAALRA